MHNIITRAGALVAATFTVFAPAFAADTNLSTRFGRGMMFSWDGFYGGINGGYGWGKHAFTDVAGTNGVKWNNDGGFLGGQLGFNWQNGQYVLGVETDLQISGIDGTLGLGDLEAKNKTNWFGTTRLRGGIIWDDTLFYGTGGLAYGRSKLTLTDHDPVEPLGQLSESKTHVGWTAGLGVERAFTKNFSAKLEYLYTDLGKKTYFQLSQESGDHFKAKTRLHMVRIGINYHLPAL